MKSKKYSENLLKLFKKQNFKVKNFDNIIESKIIIERSGEIFKKSLLSFEDDDGKNFSLRPDLTISACLDYIKNIKNGEYKYTYFDQAYRRTFGAKSLVRNQLGCEIIGSSSKKSDVEIINLIEFIIYLKLNLIFGCGHQPSHSHFLVLSPLLYSCLQGPLFFP